MKMVVEDVYTIRGQNGVVVFGRRPPKLPACGYPVEISRNGESIHEVQCTKFVTQGGSMSMALEGLEEKGGLVVVGDVITYYAET